MAHLHRTRIALRSAPPYLSRAMSTTFSSTFSSISTTNHAPVLEPEANPTTTEQPHSAQTIDHSVTSVMPDPGNKQEPDRQKQEQKQNKNKKTMAELDEELKLKMAGLAGDGGEAGVELEDGQPVAMKRSVKNNMFRYI